MDYEQNSETYPIGTMIANRYEIVQFLAAGGMAQVYIARQQLVDRLVAVKVLSAAFSMNPGVVKRFFREAKVIGALENQENTVRIYDMGETDDKRLFIAMELLKGEELSERIRREPLSPGEAFPIVRQVACSLSAAHKRGIIHRDLKPDNIFLTEQGVVKVLDFGIAKLKEDDQSDEMGEKRLTKAGTAPGTPEYMSPEQARGKELDARSDLYSLGIVIYEMLCGHPPFEEATFLGTILLHIQTPPPPLPETLPVQLRNYIINRMLAKDPNCRPDNADVFLSEWDDLSKKLKLGKDEADEAESELSRAQAEIEALRSRLAQTEMELMRSGEPGTNVDNPVPPSSVTSAVSESSDTSCDEADAPLNFPHEVISSPQSSSSHVGVTRGAQVPVRARRAMARPPMGGGLARGAEHTDKRESSQLGAAGRGNSNESSQLDQSSLGQAGASHLGQSSLGQAGASHSGQSSLGQAGGGTPPSLSMPPLMGAGKPGASGMGPGASGMGPGSMYPSGMYAPVGMGNSMNGIPNAPMGGMGNGPMSGVMPALGGMSNAPMGGMGNPMNGMPNAPMGGMGSGPMSGVMPALGGMPNAPMGGMGNPMNGMPNASMGGMGSGPVSGVMPALGGMPNAPMGGMGNGSMNGMPNAPMGNGLMSGVMPPALGGMSNAPIGGMGNPMGGMPNAPLGNGSMSVSMSALGGMPNAPMGGMGNPMNGMPNAPMGGMSNAPLGNGSMSVSMSALGGMSNAPMSKGSMSGVMPTSSGGSMAVRLPQGGYMPSVVDDEFHEPVVPPQPRHGAGAGMRGSAGGCGRMPERPSEHSMPRVPDGMRRGAMSEHPSEHGMSRVSDGMRRGAMSGGESILHSVTLERGFGVERPGAYENVSMDEESGMSRPRDSLTGMAAVRKSSVNSPEVTFMSFAQPLCNKLGPSKVGEALELAKSVWNATVEGDDAVAALFESAEGAENLRKMLDILVSRKERYFADETWSIRSLKVNQSSDGRLSIHLATIQPI